MIVLCAVNVIVALDFLGASVLLNPIGRDLHLSTADLAWVVNGYLLTLAAPLIAAGRAADRWGAVRLTRIGIVIFGAGALVTGLATTVEVLVGGRMVQGLGASVLAATGLTLVNSSTAPGNRGRVVGIWAGVGAVGSAAGPLVAGLIESVSIWRMFFLIDVPIALLVWWWLRAAQDDPATRAREPLGLASAVALTGGLGLGVFSVLQAPESGWGSGPVVGAGIAALGALTWFVVEEMRAAKPFIDRTLFAHGRGTAASVTAFVGNAAFAGVAFFASLYLQQVQGLSAVSAGAVFLAMTVPLIALSPVAGTLTQRVDVRLLMAAGMLVVAGSVAVFAVLGTESGIVTVAVALALSGIGQAFVFNVSNIAAMRGVTATAGGLASGVVNEVRQLGALIGLAAVGGALASGQRHEGGRDGAQRFVAALHTPSWALAGVCVAAAIVVVLSPQGAGTDAGTDTLAATDH